jgi:hypothetical protein
VRAIQFTLTLSPSVRSASFSSFSATGTLLCAFRRVSSSVIDITPAASARQHSVGVSHSKWRSFGQSLIIQHALTCGNAHCSR